MSGFYPVVAFDIGFVEDLDSVTRVIVLGSM
jgi:hypothetical protein